MEFPRIDVGLPLALDYETNGTKYWDPDFQVIGAAVATNDKEWYFDFRAHPGALQWLRDTIPNRSIIAQFAQFEVQCSRLAGIDPRSIDWYCTMTAECLIDEHQLTYDLASICRYNGVISRKAELIEGLRVKYGLKNKDEVMANLHRFPWENVSPYGADDARTAYDCAANQARGIESQDLGRVVRLERDLIPVLADMSWGGVRVDLQRAHDLIPVLNQEEFEIRQCIAEITGDSKFNVNSTPQIREFFKPEPVSQYQWRLIDGTLVPPTKGGKGPSIGQDQLREMHHPLAAQILALRKTIKLRDTFIRGHIIGSADGEGYIHTTFNQTRNDADAGTVTGRLSSTDPALQQITKRDKANAARLRAAFLPDQGQEWLCEDYSQVDFRCSAHLINDPSIIQAYQDNPALDYHQIVSDMTDIPRNAAYPGAPNTKQINLGLAFGAGAGKLAFMMKMPYTIGEYRGRMAYQPGPEAKAIFKMYHGKLPGVQKFMKYAESVANANGFVKTAIGRRLRHCGHKAAGLLYQAYAADLHKIGLVEVDKVIREEKLPARLMLSVHDEIGVSAEESEYVKERIRERYTDFNSDKSQIRMRVPITASAKFGPNWYEASKD